MGNSHLDILAREVDRRIERILGHILVQEVEQTILRDVVLSVELHRQPLVQVGVVAHQLLDILQVVAVGTEDLLIDRETDHRAVLLLNAALPAIRLLQALLEVDRMRLAVTHRASHKVAREVVHGLHTDTVQTHRLLEGGILLVVVVLTARVHHTHGCRQSTERNTAAVVTHRHGLILDRDLDLATKAVHVLVDRVVRHLLDQDIDTVIGLGTVAQLADIHTGAQADMFTRREGLNRIVAVILLGCIE